MTSKPVVWHPAILVRPTDNILSSEMVRLKRFEPSYEKESRHSMTKIIQNDYARIWERDRKFWANLYLPATGTNVKRTNVLLLRKVVNTNLRKKPECPEQYRSKAEYRHKLKLTNQRADHAARKTNKIQ